MNIKSFLAKKPVLPIPLGILLLYGLLNIYLGICLCMAIPILNNQPPQPTYNLYDKGLTVLKATSFVDDMGFAKITFLCPVYISRAFPFSLWAERNGELYIVYSGNVTFSNTKSSDGYYHAEKITGENYWPSDVAIYKDSLRYSLNGSLPVF